MASWAPDLGLFVWKVPMVSRGSVHVEKQREDENYSENLLQGVQIPLDFKDKECVPSSAALVSTETSVLLDCHHTLKPS